MLAGWLLVSLSVCEPGPEPTKVVDRVNALRGPGRPVVPWSLLFETHPEDVVLTATTEEQTFRRTLPADADCDALVEASAVVLLMFEGDLAEAAKARARRVLKSAVVVAPAELPVVLSSYELAVGYGVAFGQPDSALSLVARGVWRPPAWNLGIGGHVRFTTPKRLGDERIEVSWSRLDARLGPDFSFATWRLQLAVAAEVVGGARWIQASAPSNLRDFVTWDLGVAGTLRVSALVWKNWKPWLALSAIGWGRRHVVVFEAPMVQASLPSVDVELSLGISWGR